MCLSNLRDKNPGVLTAPGQRQHPPKEVWTIPDLKGLRPFVRLRHGIGGDTPEV